MTLVKKEKSFPRGGKKPAISKTKKGSFSLFTKRSAKQQKDKKRKQSSQPSEKKKKLPDSSLHLSYVQPLSNKTIKEGTVVLGCVRSIEEYKLTVSLPGKLVGEVAITSISQPYIDALENVVEGKNEDEKVLSLNEMFQLGQCIVTRVVDLGEKIKLSLMPQEVQVDWTLRSLTVGCFIMAAVRSHEENGYVMDTGIKNVRAFLKNSAAQKYESVWNKGKSLGIGQVLKCVVRKANVTSVAATLELSADPEKLCNALDDTKLSLDMLLPGTVFNTTISKVVNYGLEIEYNRKLTGYVHEEHLSEVFDSQKNYKAGNEHEAVLLYVLPMVKIAHFSFKKMLRNPEPSSIPLNSINIGDVMKGKVIHSDGRGVVLKLKHQFKGFVPIHHCSKNVAEEKEKIEIGSKRKCRVLAFDYMAETFICTLRKEFIKASILHPADLKPGMKVVCQIKEHLEKGTLVVIDASARSIMAFVRKEHMGNIPVKNPEKKFPVGSQHTAKVLHADGNNVQLTLKPKLVENEAKVLHSFKHFKKGMSCEGVVMLIKKRGLLITFFGIVKGWLPLEDGNTTDKFYVGQLLKCFVQQVNVSNEKLVLSLTGTIQEKATSQPREGYEVGHAYRVVVKSRTERELKVKGEYGTGKIPAQHLTNNPQLAYLLLNTYSPEDVIENAYCLQSQHPPIFTLQPAFQKYFQTVNGSHTWSNMKQNQLLPCTVDKVLPPKLLVQLPMKKRIPTCASTKVFPDGLVKNQCIMCRVLKKGNLSNSMCVSVKLPHCWDYTPKAGVDLLVSYWQDCKQIAKHLKKEKNPLVKLRPGDRVKGKVIATEDTGVVISLHCGIQGVVTPFLSKKDIKCGAEVEGTVVFIDYQNNCCELTINPSIMERINVKQDGKLTNGLQIGADVRGEILTVRPELVVVVLKGRGRQQLAYIPVRKHLNDFTPDVKKFQPGKTSKLIIEAVEEEKIVCILQRYEFELIKLRAGRLVQKQSSMKNTEVPESLRTLHPTLNGVNDSLSDHDDDDDDDNEGLGKEADINMDDDDEAVDQNEKIDSMFVDNDSDSDDRDDDMFVDNDSDNDDSGDDDEEEEQQQNDKKDSVLVQEDGDGDDNGDDVVDDGETDTVAMPENSTRKHASKMETIADGHKIKKRKLSALDEHKKPQDTVNTGELARLCLNGGFLWNVNPSMLLGDDEEADSDSSGENTKVDGNKKKNKLTRAERREKALREEEKTRSAELKLMNSEGPQTADDFDRLVLSSPNSSVCWIKYMAFHLQAAEIEKARAVARRAITIISFREEQEKLNVWCSLLSLENLYGTKESLEKTLEEAVTMNDPFKVYSHMLKLYSESSKTQEAEKLVIHLTKKFHEDKEAWLQGGEALLKLDKTEKSRMLMQKALNNLEKKFHVEVISRFARLENKLGDPERAQTLMEFILTSYPKRTDMWNSYVDMLVKNGQHDAARQVLERAIAQKLPVRNMKSLFSKFLQFEEQHGTPEGVEKIRQKAIGYVEASGGATSEK